MNQPLKLKVENSELTLQQLSEADAETFYAFVNKNREHLSQHETKTAAQFTDVEAAKQVIIERRSEGCIQLGIWQAKAFVGVINLKPPVGKTVEIGYAVAQVHVGKGFATTAIKCAVAYLSDQKYVRVIAYVQPRNDPSKRVLEKAGFRMTGTAFEKGLFFTKRLT